MIMKAHVNRLCESFPAEDAEDPQRSLRKPLRPPRYRCARSVKQLYYDPGPDQPEDYQSRDNPVYAKNAEAMPLKVADESPDSDKRHYERYNAPQA